MNGIEGVEQVFGYLTLDKATLSVVHVNRYECQTSYPAQWQDAAPHDGLQHPMAAQGVDQYDEGKARPPVVGMEEECHGEHPY